MGRQLGESAPPLVGRDRELDRLAGAVSRLDRGLPGLVEVVAEPGVGKSALLTALVAMLGDRPVLRARATELEQATPCGVLARAIETAGAGPQADELVRQLLGVDVATVGIPRHETFRAVRTYLGDLAAPAGTALVLDDMHWADGDSLALLEYLLDTRPAEAMLVAVAYRPRQAPLRLLSALTKPSVAPGLERIELAPLAPRDAARLVRASGWHGPTDAIVAAGGGNPLYLLALTHAEDIPVPGGVRAALLSDVDSASPAARHLARSAAVVGDPFDPDVVVEVAGLDRPSAAEAIDELHRRDVVRPESGTLLRFRHPLLRRMIYDGAPPAWRRSAHRAAITALRWRGASVLAEAAHLELCAGPGDLDAVEVLVKAAELAGPRAPASAARWLRCALERVPDTEAASLRWLDHRIGLARYLVLAGQLTEARTTLPTVTGHLPIAPDPRRTEVVVLRATVERLLGNHNDARRLLAAELALTVPDTLPHAELALELATTDLTEGNVSARTVDL
ncbi:MAG: AAA family ATPase, partial [Actinomycetota bacterium]|nr:AAA family ATPase [Actinomycetota bacterium]